MDAVSPGEAFLEAHRIYMWISLLPLVLISFYTSRIAFRIKGSPGGSKLQWIRGACRILSYGTIGILAGCIAYIEIIYLTGWTWLLGLLIFLAFPEVIVLIVYAIIWALTSSKDHKAS